MPSSYTPAGVTGPATSTDNAAARFDTTTGKLLQNSTFIIADGTGTGFITVTSSNGTYILDESTGFGFGLNGNGTRFATIAFGGVGIPQGNFSISGATYAANTVRYVLTDGASGMGIPAANQVSLIVNNADKLVVTTTYIQYKSPPTSSAGLPSGAIYSNSGIATFVP